jgi:hypothetical protein
MEEGCFRYSALLYLRRQGKAVTGGELGTAPVSATVSLYDSRRGCHLSRQARRSLPRCALLGCHQNFVAGRQGMAGLASERVERRLTAILAVDVAGYSRLMEADE